MSATQGSPPSTEIELQLIEKSTEEPQEVPPAIHSPAVEAIDELVEKHLPREGGV